MFYLSYIHLNKQNYIVTVSNIEHLTRLSFYNVIDSRVLHRVNDRYAFENNLGMYLPNTNTTRRKLLGNRYPTDSFDCAITALIK